MENLSPRRRWFDQGEQVNQAPPWPVASGILLRSLPDVLSTLLASI